ncbi:MAG: UDP-N-acetylmuramoyl-L-alanyl-D-glutamate--2,6-diaminopimelate ligase [Patescibacteria group bacterium]
MEKLLRFFEKIIPKSIYKKLQPAYHYFLAASAAFIYGFPSEKMLVIGVTGTKGKSTTSNLIHHILNSSGYKTGLATTVNFKIGDEEWLNKEGKTMLGRFKLQKLLSQMARENCVYAVIETSSEGILQFRHRFINYSAAVFTNLSPEHIEHHGSFENYRDAKIKLFEKVAQKENSVGVYNLDDENTKYFLRPKIKNRCFYALNPDKKQRINIQNLNIISNVKLTIDGTNFSFNKEKFEMSLIGEFNIYNAAAAICVGLSQNIPIEKIKKVLKSVKPVPGRMENIEEGQNFTVFVDYAHTEDSLKNALMFLKNLAKKKIIVVFGCGGDRDKSKRPKMGAVASELANKVIITSDNPRSEDQNLILSQIKSGIQNSESRIKNKILYEIVDRKQAIKKAISLAKKDDIVLIAGKGHETYQIFKDKIIHFDDREEVRAMLTNLSK